MMRSRDVCFLLCVFFSACASPKVRDYGGGDAGDDAGAGQAEDLAIATLLLPDAAYNAQYSTKLEYEGGTGTGTAWSVISGSLPSGLNVSAIGTLSGIPTDSGTFNITVQVMDSSGATAKQQFTLTVIRKKWLAYASDEKTAGQDRLFLVDISTANLTRSEITASIADYPAFTLPWYGFSPDGKKLGLIINNHLFVLDVSGNLPGQLQQVDKGSGITWNSSFGTPWSPDSKSLAYAEVSNLTANVLAVDVTGGVPTVPARVASFSNIHGIFWMTPKILFGSPNLGDTLNYTQMNNGSWSGLLQVGNSSMLNYTDLIRVAPSGLRFLGTSSAGNTSTYIVEPASGLVSFNSGTYGENFYSRDLTLVYFNAGIYSVGVILGSPIVPSLGNGSAAWANHSNYVVIGPPTAGQSVQWINPAAAPVAIVAVPSSDTLSTIAQMAYAPDDNWLGLRTNLGIYVAGGTDTGIGAPKLASLPLSSGATLMTFMFAPDSKSLGYIGQQSSSGVDELYWVDLATGTPAAPRKLNAALGTTGFNVTTASWAADSSSLGFVEHGPTSNAIGVLYIVNVLDAQSTGKLVTTAIPACTSGSACSRVRDFAFQP